MTYWALNAWFLAVVAIVGVLAVFRLRVRPQLRVRGRRRAVGAWLFAVGVTAVVLLAMTAVFDNVMISIGLVGYDPTLISGAKIGAAPLEDFAYAIAAVVLLPSLWVLLERTRNDVDVRPSGDPGSGGPASEEPGFNAPSGGARS